MRLSTLLLESRSVDDIVVDDCMAYHDCSVRDGTVQKAPINDRRRGFGAVYFEAVFEIQLVLPGEDCKRRMTNPSASIGCILAVCRGRESPASLC